MSRYPIFTCLIIIAAIFLSSCSIEGFTNDYNKLSKSEKSLVHKMTCFDSLRPGEVYRINPVMLKEELSRHPKSLVSLYNVGCSSPSCPVVPTMTELAQFADAHDCHLFLIMTNYIPIRYCPDIYSVSIPIYVIDNKYYREIRRYKYERYFLNDMIGYPTFTKYKDIPEEYQFPRLFVFEGDSIVGVIKDLSDTHIIDQLP